MSEKSKLSSKHDSRADFSIRRNFFYDSQEYSKQKKSINYEFKTFVQLIVITQNAHRQQKRKIIQFFNKNSYIFFIGLTFIKQ